MILLKNIALILLITSHFTACSQANDNQKIKLANSTIMENKMKVEIWSDIMCPFCYIGKRKFETALAQFPHKDKVELVWKSFQLSPEMKTEPNITIHQFLADHKGMSLEQAKGMNDQVTQLAKQVGLTFDFNKSIVANSFNAHRFAHFAKQYGKQNEAEETLFRSYFTDGKNIDDYPTLIQLGAEIGLDTTALKIALENGSYADDVRKDIYEAQQVGVRGVPFFVFDRKVAVSGAQDSKTFLEALEKTFNEWIKTNPENTIEVIEGQVCSPEGECK
jgi:predicted DsbA family dithiol-disulfide isomerase